MADQKDETYQCCCGHITTVAKIIAIIGIVLSGISFISAIFYWYYLPSSIALLIVYILVFMGISKHRPGFLLPAIIILAISIVLNVLLIIALFVMAFVLPSSLNIQIRNGDQIFSYYNYGIEQAKKVLQQTLLILAFVLALAMSYTIFSFVVIKRARKYLLKTASAGSSTVLPTISSSSSMYPNGCNK